MALNYAKALSHYENKGKLGLPEVFIFKLNFNSIFIFQHHDHEAVLNNKCDILSKLLRASKFCVVLTGAGFSYECFITQIFIILQESAQVNLYDGFFGGGDATIIKVNSRILILSFWHSRFSRS